LQRAKNKHLRDMASSLETSQTIGARIKDARNKCNLNQAQLCEQSNVSISTLKKIEGGTTKGPQTKTLEKLAKPLGVPAGFLRTGELPPATDCTQGVN